MATNPMKRREHNAFLIGIVIGLIIVLIVGFLLYNLYNKTRTEYANYRAQQESLQKKVVVASRTIESGATLTEDDFEIATVVVSMDTDDCFTDVDDIFLVEGPDGELLEPEDNEIVARLEIPEGAIVTRNLIEDQENSIGDDTRIREYNSIVLPSQLKTGDIIDVRLALPSGQDFIVLSKKTILECDETTIWMKVNEADILLMNSAMVEAWTITGAKLYAIQYADAGMQQSAYVTYQPTAEVTTLISENPNIVSEAADNLAKQWNNSNAAAFREVYIDGYLEQYIDNRDSAVESGFAEETSNIRSHRSDYIDSLDE